MLTPEQINLYREKYSISPVGTPTPATKDIRPKSPGLVSRIGTEISQAGEQIERARVGEGEFEGQSPIQRGVKMAATAATAVPRVAAEVLPQPIRTGLEKTGEAIGKGFTSLTEAIGSNPQLQKWTQEHPEAFNKLSEVLGTTSAGGEIAGTILGGKGTAVAGQKAAALAGQAGAAALQKAAPTAGKVLKGVGEKAYGLTVIPEESTRLAMQAYQAKGGNLMQRMGRFLSDETPEGKPITEAETAARVGLRGTEWRIGVQSKQAADTIWNGIISPSLEKVKGKVNMDEFFNKIKKKIVAENPELTRRADLLEGLEALSEPYKGKKFSLKELQDIKSQWAEFIPEATYKGKPIASALKDVKNLGAGNIRELIYKHLGDEGKQAYLDYGNLQSIMKAGIKSVGDPAKKSIGRNVWEMVMDRAVTPIATSAGKVLYRTGEGLEFVGGKGAKTVKDIIGNTTDIPTKLPVKSLTSEYKPPRSVKLPVKSQTSDFKDFLKEIDLVKGKNIPKIEMGSKTKPKKENIPTINY